MSLHGISFEKEPHPFSLAGLMNISIEHIAIPSPNPTALKNWYERVLGAREIFNNGQNPPTFLITLPGGGGFEIYAAEGAPADRGNNKLAGFRHIALRVDSWARQRRNWRSAE